MTSDTEGVFISRITVERRLSDDDDLIDSVITEDSSGEDLPLVEALGMLRLAEDTLIHGPDPEERG